MKYVSYLINLTETLYRLDVCNILNTVMTLMRDKNDWVDID